MNLPEKSPGLPDVASADVDALLSRVEADLARERGLASHLRSLPTRVRRTLLVAPAVLLVGALVLVKSPIVDDLWALLAMTSVSISAVVLLFSALRPLYLPARPLILEHLAIAWALTLPVAIALLAPDADATIEGPLGCMLTGGLVATAMVGLASLLSRARTPRALRRAAGGAGLVAFAALSAICESHETAHLLFGHVSVVWGAVGLLGAGLAWFGRIAAARV